MRYILKLSFDGSGYLGFQKQKDPNTIQEHIENALKEVLGQEINIVASGRTDAGVSAIEQICHFDYEDTIDSRRFIGYMNSILPKTIRINNIEECGEEFHARFSAKNKTYEYWFYIGQNSIPVYDRVASNIGYNIDISKIIKACKYIKGEHDFTSFCASNTSVVDKVRTIYDIDIVSIDNNLYKLVITGNGFLYNMVRIIMGTLVDVGMGKISPETVKLIIESKDRSKAGKTAEPKGLYLKKVSY